MEDVSLGDALLTMLITGSLGLLVTAAVALPTIGAAASGFPTQMRCLSCRADMRCCEHRP